MCVRFAFTILSSRERRALFFGCLFAAAGVGRRMMIAVGPSDEEANKHQTLDLCGGLL